MVFSEQARVFEWIKGTKDDKGNKISKSKWEEKYFGKVSTDNFNILWEFEPGGKFSQEVHSDLNGEKSGINSIMI